MSRYRWWDTPNEELLVADGLAGPTGPTGPTGPAGPAGFGTSVGAMSLGTGLVPGSAPTVIFPLVADYWQHGAGYATVASLVMLGAGASVVAQVQLGEDAVSGLTFNASMGISTLDGGRRLYVISEDLAVEPSAVGWFQWDTATEASRAGDDLQYADEEGRGPNTHLTSGIGGLFWCELTLSAVIGL